MRSSPAPSGTSRADVILLLSLYLFEVSALLLLITLPRMGNRPILTFLGSRPGLLCLMAVPIFVASSVVIAQHYHKSRRGGLKQFTMTVVMNLATLVSLLTIGEMVIRLFSSRTAEGLIFMGTPLLPRSWSDEVARNREILQKAPITSSYLVYDNLTGWTVGLNRRSADGLNFSSTEGIRSPRLDMAFADLPTAHRIALVGDSYTFCLDVAYEESWGYQLERQLGPDFQVLNFGVSGYGLDQAYLRYHRDVRPWKPDIVIFGVFPHDLVRTMNVYPFISFPEWGYPFAKPRFVVAEDKLVPLSVSPLAPEAIFSKNSIEDLPFLDYDWGYNRAHWQWHFYHQLHLLRLWISKYPLWQAPVGQNSDEAMKSVNGHILRSFVQHATAESSIPMVVYLPARIDLRGVQSGPENGVGFAQEVLRSVGLAYTDLTSCLLEVSPSQRFVSETGRHYAPKANIAVANCLRPVILKLLSEKEARAAESLIK